MTKKATKSTQSKPVPPQGNRAKILAFAAKWLVVLSIWGLVIGTALVAWLSYDLPDVEDAVASTTRRAAVTLLAAGGERLASYGDDYRQPVDISEVAPTLPQAIMATEDRRFYSHWGIDLWGLARAMVANLRAMRIVQGGSTLTQQVAKNLFLTPDRTLKRKVQEVLLAVWLERTFTKDQILTLYINRVYLGAGTYGMEAASQRYFGKSARHVTLYESALLAGLLKAPSRYNPAANPDLAAKRTAVVLNAMVDAGYITKPEADAAKRRQGKAYLESRQEKRTGRYFADWIMGRIDGFVGAIGKDIRVTTTLDASLQYRAERAVERMLAGPGAKVGATQAAVIVLSTDGAIRAMVGGRSYYDSQFNRATQALRQPGSAFKTFVYLSGFEAGLSPSSQMVDGPVTIGDWKPQNIDGKHAGAMSLKTAFARSVNTVAVKVGQKAGFSNVANMAKRLGITSPLGTHPSLALGAGEVTLMELTAAYGAIANGGFGVWPYGIANVRDAANRPLFERSGGGPGRILASKNVTAIKELLSEVVATGSGRAARFGRPAYGKTGTSQDFRDAWFIGFTDRLVAGVWIGNDNGAPMKKVTGGGLPAQLWRDVMQAAYGEGRYKSQPTPKPAPAQPNPAQEEPNALRRFLDGIFGN